VLIAAVLIAAVLITVIVIVLIAVVILVVIALGRRRGFLIRVVLVRERVPGPGRSSQLAEAE